MSRLPDPNTPLILRGHDGYIYRLWIDPDDLEITRLTVQNANSTRKPIPMSAEDLPFDILRKLQDILL